MDHRYYQERLSAFADSELRPDEHARVADHLNGCVECRRRLQELRNLARLVDRDSSLAESDYWEEAAGRIEQRIDSAGSGVTDVAEERRRRKLGWWWKVPAIAASVLIVGYIGLHESDIIRDDVMIPPAERTAPGVHPEAGRVGTPDESELPLVEGKEADQEVWSEPQPVIASPMPTESDVPLKTRAADKDAAAEAQMKVPVEERILLRRERPATTVPDIVPPPEIDAAGEQRVVTGEKSEIDQQETKAGIPAPTVTEEQSEAQVVDHLALKREDYDDNYKSRPRRKASASLADTSAITVHSAEELEQVLDYELAEVSDDSVLDYWRERRDSLLDFSDAREKKRSLFKPDAVAGYAQSPLIERSDSAGTRADQTEYRLMEAWFHICKLSADPVETSKGVEFLRTVAADKHSPNRKEAAAYLELIERQ